MQIKTIQVLTADEGKVLVKDGNYCASVMLKFGETADGWSEITEAEYEAIIEAEEGAEE